MNESYSILPLHDDGSLTVQVPTDMLYGSAQAKREKTRSGYKITAPGGGSVMLKRGVDFGEVSGRDCIWKGGAEKLALAYGMLQHYTVEVAEEKFGKDEEAFFFYRVRCDLVKVAQNGQEYVFSTGRGSSNSREKSNSKQNPYDVSNKILKIASKRALSSAAIALTGLSDLFTVDLEEDELYRIGAKRAAESSAEDALTSDEQNAIFAIAEKAGYSLGETKKMLNKFAKDNGYKSVAELKHRDYKAVCELFTKTE